MLSAVQTLARQERDLLARIRRFPREMQSFRQLQHLCRVTERSLANLDGVLEVLVRGWLGAPATPHLTELVLSLLGLSTSEAPQRVPEWWIDTGSVRTDTWVPTDAVSGLPLNVRRNFDGAHLVLIPGFPPREAFYIDAYPVTFGTFHKAGISINLDARLDHAAEPERPAYNLCNRMVKGLCDRVGGQVPSVEEWWRAILGVPEVFLEAGKPPPAGAHYSSELSALSDRVDPWGEVPWTPLGLQRVLLPDPAIGSVELAAGHVIDGSQPNFSTRFRRIRLVCRVAGVLRERFDLKQSRPQAARLRPPRLNLLRPQASRPRVRSGADAAPPPWSVRPLRPGRRALESPRVPSTASGPEDLPGTHEQPELEWWSLQYSFYYPGPGDDHDARGLSELLEQFLDGRTVRGTAGYVRSRRLPALIPGAPSFVEHSHHGVLRIFKYVVDDFRNIVPALTGTTKNLEDYGGVLLQLLTVYPDLLELEFAAELLEAAEALAGEEPSDWYATRLACARTTHTLRLSDQPASEDPDPDGVSAPLMVPVMVPGQSASGSPEAEAEFDPASSPEPFPLEAYWGALNEARQESDLPERIRRLETLLAASARIRSLGERLGETHFALACSRAEAGESAAAEASIRTTVWFDRTHPGNSSLLAALDMLFLGFLYHRRGDTSLLPDAARVLAASVDSVFQTRNQRRFRQFQVDCWTSGDRLVTASTTTPDSLKLLKQMFEALQGALPAAGNVLDSYDLEAYRRIRDFRHLLRDDPDLLPFLPLFEVPDIASVTITTRARAYLRILTRAGYIPRS